MLRLERMEMVGFKSFGDKTEVVFPEGITAVVGPNGCGKSNIGDAINWVLGEQSAKMLRGASMEDVIFNGSEKRKAVGMAEVSLYLGGQNGAPERREVVLTRRLFRDGNSEYLINGERSRLKDIQEVLREAHVGAKTYATIEQGRIDQILNAKPKERRLLIEEAAGVAGYKQKRRLTELKLDATQANLLRVNDILLEVRRQINALKRQAAKARRYQRLRDDLRAKEGVRFGLLAGLGDERVATARADEASGRNAEVQAAARLAAFEAELAAERLSIEEAARALQDKRDRLHRASLGLNEQEARSRQCRDRIAEGQETDARLRSEAESLAVRGEAIDAEIRAHAEQEADLRRNAQDLSARVAALAAQFEDAERRSTTAREETEGGRRGLFESTNAAAEARNRARGLDEALERNRRIRERRLAEQDAIRGDLARLEEESARLAQEVESHARAVTNLAADHAAAEEKLGGTRQRLRTAEQGLARARERESSASSRLTTLEDVATRFAGVSEGVRLLLSAGASAGVRTHGVVADYLEAGEEVEAAAEAYLQSLLPAVILEDDGDVRGAAELLRTRGTGRTVFLCKTHPVGEPAVGAPGNGSFPIPPGLLADPRVLGRLRDRIRLKGANGFLDKRIGDAVLVDRLDSALELHREHPQVDYVAVTGEVVYASGLVAAGGVKSTEHGLLAHTRRIQSTRLELEAARSEVGSGLAEVEALRSEVARLEAEVVDLRGRSEDARRKQVELALHVERSGEERNRTGRTTEMLAAEIEQIDEERRVLTADFAAAKTAVEQAEGRHAALESDFAARVAALESLEATIRRLSEELGGLRAEAQGSASLLAAAERESLRRGAEARDVAQRIAAADAEGESARARVAEATEQLASVEEERLRLLALHEGLAGEVSRGEVELDERRRLLAEREAGTRDMRSALDSAREALRTAELALAAADADRRHLDDLCLQELAITASEARERAGEALAGADAAVVEGEIAVLRERIEAIGPVNMTAIAEFADLEQRHAFLDAQKTDLENSIASLRDTIRRINSTSREKFLEAFEAVRRSYVEIFQLLFGGGRADLRLEEGDDVLESGIEILAQPPGKRLASVQLMSGGEKAMSAIALLFAIFRYQPSPFCLLDEVDAALDDLNVNRFNRMLREYAGSTQFILITHNKLSMDSANLLYGVTMEEPGVSRLVSLKLEA